MLIVILFLTVEEPFFHSEYTILYPHQEYMSSSFITPSPKLILKKKKKKFVVAILIAVFLIL